MSCLRYDGAAPHCALHIPKGNCHCCEFVAAKSNFIPLLPGEEHLRSAPNLIAIGDGDPDHVRCTVFANGETECPLGDDKPIDCKLYPVYPSNIDVATSTIEFIYGEDGCPMSRQEMTGHAERAAGFLLDLCAEKPGLAEWLARTALVTKGTSVIRHLVTYWRDDEGAPT